MGDAHEGKPSGGKVAEKTLLVIIKAAQQEVLGVLAW